MIVTFSIPTGSIAIAKLPIPYGIQALDPAGLPRRSHNLIALSWELRGSTMRKTVEAHISMLTEINDVHSSPTRILDLKLDI